MVLINLDDVGPERSREEKTEEVNSILRNAFASLEASSFTSGAAICETINATQWTQASDYELITAAREHDIDAIALVHVDQYAGALAIGFFPIPGWSARTDVAYHLRVLDVETGRVLADYQRHRKTGGFFGFSRRAYLARDFENDLADLVSLASDSR